MKIKEGLFDGFLTADLPSGCKLVFWVCAGYPTGKAIDFRVCKRSGGEYAVTHEHESFVQVFSDSESESETLTGRFLDLNNIRDLKLKHVARFKLEA